MKGHYDQGLECTRIIPWDVPGPPTFLVLGRYASVHFLLVETVFGTFGTMLVNFSQTDYYDIPINLWVPSANVNQHIRLWQIN